MIRLARHDEIVEAMAEIIRQMRFGSVFTNQEISTAALDAMLEAVVKLGVADVFPFPDKPCINIMLEARDDE